MSTKQKNEANTFTEELKEFLTDSRISTKDDLDGQLESAKCNISTFITDEQLDIINDLAGDYDLRYQIKRSGAGLVIEFNKQ